MGRIVVEHAGLQETAREAPHPEDHLPWLQHLGLQQCLQNLVSQRSCAEDEHGNTCAGLRVQHFAATSIIECDKALKNGGFAAAREGVDDMGWGVRHGHRGQNAPRCCWSMILKAAASPLRSRR